MNASGPDGGPRPRPHFVEVLLGSGRRASESAENELVPAWRRATDHEPRLSVSLTILAAVALMLVLPDRIANHPRWLLPGIAVLLLVGILVANSTRVDRRSSGLRIASLVMIGALTVANVASGIRLVLDLVHSRGIRDPAELLLTGGAIWLTNMIVFALWYWEFDSGGPAVRAVAPHPYPDFLFPQMSSPDLAPKSWEPAFVDYFYLSFTNATAFSPTDVMPLSRWTKITMLAQSAVSLMLVALVIARAVNVLR